MFYMNYLQHFALALPSATPLQKGVELPGSRGRTGRDILGVEASQCARHVQATTSAAAVV